MKSLLALLAWNLVVFILYGVDKFKAIHRKRRVSENCMIFSALFFGGVGATLAMMVFRHKIRKAKFLVTAFFALIIFAVTVFLMLKRCGLI